MYSDLLSKIHFWGWQLIIVAAAVTLMAGFTVSKEYAELEWPIDIAITIIWVIFGITHVRNNSDKKRKTHVCGYMVLYRFVGSYRYVTYCKLYRNSGDFI